MKQPELEDDAYYLKVTIHDNDFKYDVEFVANMLNAIFQFFDAAKKSIIDNLFQLQNCIKELLYQTHSIMNLVDRYNSGISVPIDYFEPKLEVVTYNDIPDWDNGESVYVPLFEGSIICR